MLVTAVVTQGRSESNYDAQHVSQFRVEVSTDGVKFEPVNGTFNNNRGNHRTTSRFNKVAIARYIRLLPLKWNVHVDIRAGVAVMRTGE